MSFGDNLTIQDCINYMKSQIRQMEKYPANYKYNTPYYRKTVEYLEQAKDRPHGEWIEKPSYKEDKELGIDKQVVCSKCDEQNSNYVYGKDGQIEGKMFIRSNFCPNCGASMRKEGDEE